jgi:hypothetical protein
VRTDRAAVVDPVIARLSAEDRATLAAAVQVMRRLLDNAASAPRIPRHRRPAK